jgi:hypothetical protein
MVSRDTPPGGNLSLVTAATTTDPDLNVVEATHSYLKNLYNRITWN